MTQPAAATDEARPPQPAARARRSPQPRHLAMRIPPVTDAQIRALCREALAHGDAAQAAICRRALGCPDPAGRDRHAAGRYGRTPDARAECARVIADAAAQQDTPPHD